MQVINSRTAKYHFGHGFADNYEDAYVIRVSFFIPSPHTFVMPSQIRSITEPEETDLLELPGIFPKYDPSQRSDQ